MKNLNAIITGASYGIGYEFAKILANKGFNLILVSRSEDKLSKIQNEFEKQYNIKVFIFPIDLSLTDSAEKLFQYCTDNNLEIDILINNAGAGLFGETIENSLEDIDRIITLNITTPTKLCKLFASRMALKKFGYILNVASMASLVPIPYFGIYSATKSYLLNFSISLQNELKENNVFVTCLLPGYVKTNFDNNAKITSEKYKNFSKKIGMEPDKVAKIGIDAMLNKKNVIIPGFINKILSIFINFIPKTIIAKLLKDNIKNLIKN